MTERPLSRSLPANVDLRITPLWSEAKRIGEEIIGFHPLVVNVQVGLGFAHDEVVKGNFPGGQLIHGQAKTLARSGCVNDDGVAGTVQPTDESDTFRIRSAELVMPISVVTD